MTRLMKWHLMCFFLPLRLTAVAGVLFGREIWHRAGWTRQSRDDSVHNHRWSACAMGFIVIFDGE